MITWYLNRLKTFSIPEYPFRIKQFLTKKYQKHFSSGRYLIPGDYRIRKNILGDISFASDINDTLINIFGKEFDFADVGAIDWHKDIFSGKVFPAKFSKEINILSDPQLSAKVVWEINRMQFLMKIAINYNITGDTSYLNHLINIIKSWITHNPYLTGINWYSNIEVNLRLITWFLCWEVIDGDKLVEEDNNFKVFAESNWIPAIYTHCVYSYQNPSKYSSANNHLISEYAGLFITSSKWIFPESEKWKKYSRKGLEKEIVKQHSSRGINREQAAEYIQFITDFFLIAFVVGEKTSNPFSQKYKSTLKNILTYISDFLDMKGNFPAYGDEDDGKCFIVDFDLTFNNFRSLLTSGAIIFKDTRLKKKSNGFDLKNKLLFGESSKEVFNSIPEVSTEEKSEFYLEEGHFYFKKHNEKKEIYLHFDAAPLGFLSIAAHGHADALSIILHIDGNPVLVDPGTFTYHTDKKWRNYFVSTLAHNSICIDGLNQAVQGGPTMWLKHYETKVLDIIQTTKEETVKATHNGYKRTGCTHQRTVFFDRDLNKFIISDEIGTDNRNHEIFQPWHLHPFVEIKRLGEGIFHLRHKEGNRSAKITLDRLLTCKTITGQLSPISGWFSPSFLQKEKTTVIFGKIKSVRAQTIHLQTIIEIL